MEREETSALSLAIRDLGRSFISDQRNIADTCVTLFSIPPAHNIFYTSFVLKKRVDDPYAILNIKEFAFL